MGISRRRAIDRVAADRPFYSGKHHKHGMNLQVIASPEGEIVWVSGALPGAVHDLNAARIWGIVRELASSRLLTLSDKGYQGTGEHVITPYKGRNKPASQKAANRAHAKLRSPGERVSAQLKTWRILRKLRCCPLARRATGQGHPRSSDPRNRRMKTLIGGRLLSFSGPRWWTLAMRALPALLVALAAAVSVTACTGRPRLATPDRGPRRSPQTVDCDQIIQQTGQPGGRLVLGVLATPSARLEQAASTATRPWAYFTKHGIAIRAGSPAVLIIVPQAWRHRAGIGWGTIPASSARSAS